MLRVELWLSQSSRNERCFQDTLHTPHFKAASRCKSAGADALAEPAPGWRSVARRGCPTRLQQSTRNQPRGMSSSNLTLKGSTQAEASFQDPPLFVFKETPCFKLRDCFQGKSGTRLRGIGSDPAPGLGSSGMPAGNASPTSCRNSAQVSCRLIRQLLGDQKGGRSYAEIR